MFGRRTYSLAVAGLLTLASPALALAQETAPAPPAAVQTVSPGQAELDAAKANLPKMKVRPKFISGAQPDFPDAERLAGHHGEALISGVLGVDGRLHFAKVATSSGAPVLDGLALAAAQTALFEPAKDADGAAIAVPISVPQEFYSYKSAERGGGLVHYQCRQFAADMDWWRATFPNAKWSDHELYAMMLGVSVISHGGFGGLDGAGLKATLADFERRWIASIDKCRARPDKRFVEMLQPEGRAAEALAKSQ